LAILGAFLDVGRLVVLADPRGRHAGRAEVGLAGRSAARGCGGLVRDAGRA